MKLPASLVKTWGDLQLNFDALAKKIDPYVEAASFQGAWPTSTPGATAGIPFTVPKTGRALIDCDATAYTTSGLGLQLEVFVDGLSTGRSMVLSFNCPANLHQPLGPCKIARHALHRVQAAQRNERRQRLRQHRRRPTLALGSIRGRQEK
jgi:hypothetical protein